MRSSFFTEIIILLYVAYARTREDQGKISVPPLEAFDHIQHLLEAPQILRRIIIDINPSLFIVADERHLSTEHRTHPFDKRLEFRAFGRGRRGFFRLQHLGAA